MQINHKMPSRKINELEDLNLNFTSESNEIIDFFGNLDHQHLEDLYRKYSNNRYREILLHFCRYIDLQFRQIINKNIPSILLYSPLRIIDRDKLKKFHSDKDWREFGSGSEFKQVFNPSVVNEFQDDKLLEHRKIGKTSSYSWTHVKLSKLGWFLGILLESELNPLCKNSTDPETIEYQINQNYFEYLINPDLNVDIHPGIFISVKDDLKKFTSLAKRRIKKDVNVLKITGKSGIGKSSFLRSIVKSQSYLNILNNSKLVRVNLSEILSFKDKETAFVDEILNQIAIDKSRYDPINIPELYRTLIKNTDPVNIFLVLDQFDHFIEYGLKFQDDDFIRNLIVKLIEPIYDDSLSNIKIILVYTDPNRFTFLLQDNKNFSRINLTTGGDYTVPGLSRQNLEYYFFENLMKLLAKPSFESNNVSSTMENLYNLTNKLVDYLANNNQFINPFEFAVLGLHFSEFIKDDPISNFQSVYGLSTSELNDFIEDSLLSFENTFQKIKSKSPFLMELSNSIKNNWNQNNSNFVTKSQEELELFETEMNKFPDLSYLFISTTNMIGFRHDLILQKFQKLNLELDTEEKKVMNKVHFITNFNSIVLKNKTYTIPPFESMKEIYEKQPMIENILIEKRASKEEVQLILEVVATLLAFEFPVKENLFGRIVEEDFFLRYFEKIQAQFMLDDEINDPLNILGKLAINFWIEFNNYQYLLEVYPFLTVFKHLPPEDIRSVLTYVLKNENSLPEEIEYIEILASFFLEGLQDKQYQPYLSDHLIESIHDMHNYGLKRRCLIIYLKLLLNRKIKHDSDLTNYLLHLIRANLPKRMKHRILKLLQEHVDQDILQSISMILNWLKEVQPNKKLEEIDSSSIQFIYQMNSAINLNSIIVENSSDKLDKLLIELIHGNFTITDLSKKLADLVSLNQKEFDDLFESDEILTEEHLNQIHQGFQTKALETYFDLGLPSSSVKSIFIDLLKKHLRKRKSTKDTIHRDYDHRYQEMYSKIFEEEISRLDLKENIQKIVKEINTPITKSKKFIFSPQVYIDEVLKSLSFKEKIDNLVHWLDKNWRYNSGSFKVLQQWMLIILREMTYIDELKEVEFTNLDDLFSDKKSGNKEIINQFFKTLYHKLYNIINDPRFIKFDNLDNYDDLDLFTGYWTDFWIFGLSQYFLEKDKLTHLDFTKEIFDLVGTLKKFYTTKSSETELQQILNNSSVYQTNESLFRLSLLNQIIEKGFIERIYKEENEKFVHYILQPIETCDQLQHDFCLMIIYPINIKFLLNSFSLLLRIESEDKNQNKEITYLKSVIDEIVTYIDRLLDSNKDNINFSNLIDFNFHFKYNLSIESQKQEIFNYIDKGMGISSTFDSFIGKWMVILFSDLFEQIYQKTKWKSLAEQSLTKLKEVLLNNKSIIGYKSRIYGNTKFEPFDLFNDTKKTNILKFVQALEIELNQNQQLLSSLILLMSNRNNYDQKLSLFDNLFGNFDLDWMIDLIRNERKLIRSLEDITDLDEIREEIKCHLSADVHQMKFDLRGRDLGLIAPILRLVKELVPKPGDSLLHSHQLNIPVDAPLLFHKFIQEAVIRINEKRDHFTENMKKDVTQIIKIMEELFSTILSMNIPNSKLLSTFTNCHLVKNEMDLYLYIGSRSYQSLDMELRESSFYWLKYLASFVFIYIHFTKREKIKSLLKNILERIDYVKKQIETLRKEYYNKFDNQSLSITGSPVKPTNNLKIYDLYSLLGILQEFQSLIFQIIDQTLLPDNLIISFLKNDHGSSFGYNYNNLNSKIITAAIERGDLHAYLINYWRKLPTKVKQTTHGGGWQQSDQWKLINRYPKLLALLHPKYLQESEIFDFILFHARNSHGNRDPLDDFREYLPQYLIRKFIIYRKIKNM